MPEKTFNCQRCNTPIRLDQSLLKLSPAQLNLIINRNHNHADDNSNREILEDLHAQDFIPKDRLDTFNDALQTNSAPVHYHNMIESEDDFDEEDEADEDEEWIQEENTNGGTQGKLDPQSYIVLSDGEDSVEGIGSPDPDNMFFLQNDERSSRIKTLTKIFEILSSNSDIEHPLSSECAILLIENYKLKFDQSQKEKDNYLAFLKKLKDKDNQLNLFQTDNNNGHQRGVSPGYSEDLDTKLKDSIEEFNKLSLIEKEKLVELKKLEETNKELQLELKSNKKELKELNENQLENILKLKNKLQLDLDRQYNKLEQSKAAYKVHLNHLDKLRNLNIYNKIFNISFEKDDKYSSINGFRLGYRVVWPEVNAALGQIVHLLIFLCKRLKLELDGYQLVLLGSQSQIIKFSNETTNPENPTGLSRTVLNLFSSNEFSLGKLFNFNKLDVSMIALLDVISQIEKRLVAIDNEFELPYKLSAKKDSIGGKSIRPSSNSEWTQSCKFLLTDLNWILAYTSVHTSPG